MPSAVFYVAFSPDSKTLASGSGDHSVRLWDVATGKEVRQFTGHTERRVRRGLPADGKRLVSGGSDGCGDSGMTDTGASCAPLRG